MIPIGPLPPAAPPRTVIDHLLTTHGTWRVLRALAASLLQPHRRPRPAEAPTPRLRDELSDHLRRDIGLPPTEPPPRRWHGPPC